ncbi:MAG: hypothetical protein M1457_07530 [bacterium]|nr:hypothetical protein [bacterium]
MPPAPTAAPEPQPPTAKPIPATEHLPTHELIAVLSTESDPDRQWRIIEANLMQRRPERTYPLLLRHGDLIAEHCQAWPPARLKAVFTTQPGSVLIGLMHGWCVNQVLAIAEDNAESEQILTFLREREIDRLMKISLDVEITSVEEARKALCIDRFADEPAIKKTWRTLLGFMNADHGRASERAIHRKKDEIAKHLQTARNVLLKNR